jgi:hypothetical protein
VDGTKPLIRPWVKDPDWWEEALRQLRQLLPYAKGIPTLGATAQLLEPEAPDASHERLEERMAGGNCIVLQPPPEHALQPSGYLLRVVVAPTAQDLTDPLKRAPGAFGYRLPPETETALSCGSAVMREPQKIKGFGVPLTA